MPKFEVTVTLNAEKTIVVDAPSKKILEDFLEGDSMSVASAIVEYTGSADEELSVLGYDHLEKAGAGARDPDFYLDKDGDPQAEPDE